MEKPRWRRIASRYVVDSRFLKIRRDTVELPNGAVLPEYYVRESAGFVMIVAFTPNDEVVLVHQYRYGSDSIGLEVPAGMLEPDEEPKACAVRELLEETGYEPGTIDLVGDYEVEPVRSNARVYIFMARDARRVGEPQPEQTEHIEVELVPERTFAAMLEDGRIDNLASIAAGYRALAARTSVR